MNDAIKTEARRGERIRRKYAARVARAAHRFVLDARDGYCPSLVETARTYRVERRDLERKANAMIGYGLGEEFERAVNAACQPQGGLL